MVSAAAIAGLVSVISLFLFAAYFMRQLGAADLAQLTLIILSFAVAAALAGALLA